MTIEIASFIFGSLLILTGLLGGGFQAREISIPRIGIAMRGACITVGVLFILIGISLTVRPAPNPTPGPGPSPVSIRIHNRLGEGQVSEQVKVVIDGTSVGTMTVSAAHPHSEMLVSVPREDRYGYHLTARAVFLNGSDRLVEYVGTGQGYINVKSGMEFSLEGTISGETWLASLVEGQ